MSNREIKRLNVFCHVTNLLGEHQLQFVCVLWSTDDVFIYFVLIHILYFTTKNIPLKE